MSLQRSRGIAQCPADGVLEPTFAGQDAKRHGVVVRSKDLNASRATATLEHARRSVGDVAVRLGIGSVEVSAATWRGRSSARPYESLEDLVRRVPSCNCNN